MDAAHKLTILSALAFGIPMQFDKAYTEGISKLTQEDIRYAEELGYRIKLLGITKRTRRRASSCACIRRWCPTRRLIANVEGVMNAILVKGDAVGADAVLRRRRRAASPRRARWWPTWST